MRPFMTDPATVASLEGQQYLVLRPAADVAAFYKEEQRDALDRLPSGLPHPNTGHVTLRGFAEPEPERVDALLDTVSAWASSTRSIEVGGPTPNGMASWTGHGVRSRQGRPSGSTRPSWSGTPAAVSMSRSCRSEAERIEHSRQSG
ncbi:hypothetical protein ACFRFH_02970 [Leifsonia sp. NPDC056824]|uniref:hypothetical protein n=1 Tax=Leifsonia sp. NPDC056824 TaxID=3345953 RepID=UPI0036CCF2F8